MKYLALSLLILISSTMASMPGGITDNERPVTPDLKVRLATVEVELKSAVAKETNGPVQCLAPVAYKSQVVAGVNYFVSYRLNESNVYYHARIYRDLQNKMHLVAIRGPKSADDPIEYFDAN